MPVEPEGENQSFDNTNYCLYLISPNGTYWCVTVDDSGVISTTEVT